MKHRKLNALLLALTLVSYAGAANAFSISMVAGKVVKWKTDDVGYYLDANGWSGISNGSDKQAVVNSFNDWEAVSCSKLGFTKLGETSVSSVIPTGAEPNGKNEFIWKEGYFPFGSSTLGVTSPLYGYTGEIVEADIAMNGTISWNTSGGGWYASDVKSVAIHEIGHLFGQQHVLSYNEYDPPTMAPYADPSGKTATLHSDDINGICFLYPKSTYTCSSNSQCPYVVGHYTNGDEYYETQWKCQGGQCVYDSSTTGSGDIGDNCYSDNSCKSGLFCVETMEGNFCSKWCTTDGQCPSDFYCIPVEEGSNEGICMGMGIVGDGNFGDFCYTDDHCKASLTCVQWWSGSFCTKVCTDPDGGTGCPASHTCFPYEDYPANQGLCLPGTVVKKDDGQLCTADSQCKSGLCFPTPGTDTKQCRTKCNPNAPGCPSTQKCVNQPGDLTGTKGGCVPKSTLPEKPDAYDCQANWECKSEFCYFDPELLKATCQSKCNPAAPTCPEGSNCLSTAAGQGVCLPVPPEPKPNGSWCLHHYDCVSGMCAPLPGTDQKYCRKPCTSGSGCPQGQVCVFYEDPAVGLCMPEGKDHGQVCFSTVECTSQICWSPGGTPICLPPCVAGTCPAGYSCTQESPFGPVCLEVSGTLTTGATCAKDSQCLSGICLSGTCRAPCNVLVPNCPQGQGCVSVTNGQQGACVDHGPLLDGKYCTNDFKCESLFCVQAEPEKRICTQPCSIAVGDCPEGQVCTDLPELDGIGACLPESSSGGDPQDLPDVSKYIDNDDNSGSGGGCSAVPAGPLASLLLLALAILPIYLRRRIW